MRHMRLLACQIMLNVVQRVIPLDRAFDLVAGHTAKAAESLHLAWTGELIEDPRFG